MNTDKISNLAKTLQATFSPDKVKVEHLINEDVQSVHLMPSHPGKDKYAELLISFVNDYNVTVSIGNGNSFDFEIDEDNEWSQEDINFLVSCARACVDGNVHEDITKRKGRLNRSKLIILINNKKQTYKYQNGLIFLPGSKKHISYSPY